MKCFGGIKENQAIQPQTHKIYLNIFFLKKDEIFEEKNNLSTS